MYCVTIAIASYNNATYLKRCVESVLNQTYKYLDVLIVDDGSTDESLSILDSYKTDNRVRIVSKENGGLSTVRQTALDMATGEFICFIDADDYLAKTYVADLLSKIESDESDVCVCSTRFVDTEGNYLQRASMTFSCKDSVNYIVSGYDILISDELSHDLHLSDTWNKMYRTSTLKRIGVRFCMPKGLNGSDTMFNYMLSLHKLKYSTISKEDYIHVIYKNSAVHRKNRNLKKSFQIICNNMINECENMNNLDEMLPVISKKWYAWQYIILEDVYVSTKKTKELFSVVKEQKQYAKEKCLLPARIHDFKGIYGKAFLLSYNYFTCILPILYNVRG